VMSGGHCDVGDEDLIAPWLEAMEFARRETQEERITRRSEDLAKISSHVERVYLEWRKDLNIQRSKTGSSSSFTDLAIEDRQDTLRGLSRKFASISASRDVLFSSAEISRLAASYAYMYDSKQGVKRWSRFPWDVAMRELCHIKAQALGTWKTVAGPFYERFQIKGGFLHL